MNIVPTLGLRCGEWQVALQADREPAVMPAESAPPGPRRCAPQHALSGYNTTRIVMEFMRWVVERDQFPTVEAIVRRFEVSRATAYRWRNYLGETYCLQTLPPNEHEIARIGKPGAKARAKQTGGPGR